MKNILTVLRRETGAYFNSAVAYIFIIVFILVSGSLFVGRFFLISQATLRPFFDQLLVMLCMFLPAVTMRLWAEERRGNTIELLFTFPMRAHELVLGKFLASLTFYVTVLLATLPIPIMVITLGHPDPGAILCGYIGTLLTGAFYLALGLFISGFCKDQIVAFVLSMLACFAFFIMGTDLTAASLDGWIPGFGSFVRDTLGLSHRYGSFIRGVVDSAHLLYFLAGTCIFLVLNGFWLDGRLRPKAKTTFIVAASVCAGIFIFFNLIMGSLAIGRFDLTQEKIYTISPETRKILQGLDAPAHARFYVSPAEKMPTGLKTLERDIVDKLDEFRIASKNNFSYKVFHLEAADVVGGVQEGEESLEGSLLEKGIRPFQVKSVEADEVGVTLIYSSLALSYKDKPEEIIPNVVSPHLTNLEYRIISKVHKMTLDKVPHAALFAPYTQREAQEGAAPVSSGALRPDQYWEDPYRLISLALQSEGFDVSRILLTRTSPIPQGADVLVVIEPENLNDRQRFEINRFLVNGGSVFMAVQNFNFQYSNAPGGGLLVSAVRKNPQVNPLLKTWGLEVEEKFLMDTQHEVVDAVSDNRLFGVFQMSMPTKIPVQIRLTPEGINPDAGITSQVPFMLYMWGTALLIDEKRIGDAGLKLTPLLYSSPESWKVPYHESFLSKTDVTVPEARFLNRYPLAVFAEGVFPDAYRGRGAPDWPLDAESVENVPGSTNISPAAGKLVLIGCASIFQEQFIKSGGHARFFINAIDTMALGEDLVGIRGKQPIDRFIKRVSSSGKIVWRFFAIFLVPAILIVVGSLRMMARRRAKSAYLKVLEGL